MRRHIAVAAIMFFAGTSIAGAQSRAHNDARAYAEILGKAVWCNVTREDRRTYEQLAMKAIDSASYNDPESGAAQLMFKTVLAETARTNAAGDCPAVEEAFQHTYETLQTSDMPPRNSPLPSTSDEQET